MLVFSTMAQGQYIISIGDLNLFNFEYKFNSRLVVISFNCTSSLDQRGAVESKRQPSIVNLFKV